MSRALLYFRWLVVLAALFAAGCSAATTDGADGIDAGTALPGSGESAVTSTDCVVDGELEGLSVARMWNVAALEAIRLDTPAPTVHARNLYHLSAAMWDAWVLTQPDSGTTLFAGDYGFAPGAIQSPRASLEAMSFAAWKVLTNRYSIAAGGHISLASFDALLESLCLNHDMVTNGSAAAAGIAVGEAVIAIGYSDGSQQADRYTDGDYSPVNDPVDPNAPWVGVQDANRWQPLQFLTEQRTAQDGRVLVEETQTFLGSHWGNVTPFATSPNRSGVVLGGPPSVGTPKLAAEVADVLEASHLLLSDDLVDIGPQSGPALHSVPSAESAAAPERINPDTGKPYAVNTVRLGDFGKAIAEYWADGPDSETPPGHWNTIANNVTDSLGPDERRVFGEGEPVSVEEWEVKLYLALNGGLHDAAVLAWESKQQFDSSRPITLIRHLAETSELPWLDGIVYPDTGELVVWSPTGDVIDGTAWLPYQLSTFVSPSFAGYVSGHSSFSRAAAEVLAAFTGTEFFPGGLGSATIDADSFRFDTGPSTDVTLEWATYYDAADQAGRSRIWGGIHISSDDVDGRRLGAVAGEGAVVRAKQLFGR